MSRCPQLDLLLGLAQLSAETEILENLLNGLASLQTLNHAVIGSHGVAGSHNRIEGGMSTSDPHAITAKHRQKL